LLKLFDLIPVFFLIVKEADNSSLKFEIIVAGDRRWGIQFAEEGLFEIS